MSKHPSAPRPTDAELAILRVLWERGPSTVRQVHEVLVRRDDTDRSHVYTPRLSEEQTQRQLVRDLLDRAFGGSASKLVLQALNARRATAEELGEIHRLIAARREERDDRD